MKLLIVTEPDDTHALLVKIGLENMGHAAHLLFIADHPTKQTNSVYIDNCSYQWNCSDGYDSVSEHEYDVVWWRRPRRPFVPQSSVHQDDYQFVERENTLFYKSIIDNLSQHGWWVNPKEAAIRCNSKLLQLKFASQCGMLIPTTLCSNDPKKIHSFVSEFEAGGVIYKPLCANFWFEPSQTKISYTSKITQRDIPSNHLLQLSPGIFQKEIKKQYELRVTCFGSHIVAVKIHSQDHPDGMTDWRAVTPGELRIEPYRLPQLLQQQILNFMQLMGIVFGAFDLIATPEGEYVFLEVNEQGQFLWIEDFNPDIPMLDIFINFITHHAFHFQWNDKTYQHSNSKYEKLLPKLVEQNITRHVDLNHSKLQPSKENLC